MFHIYLCYVTRGTRATRLEDRGRVTIDDLWTIRGERVWWLNGRTTRRDSGAWTWNIVAYNFAGYLALRRAACATVLQHYGM